MLLVFLHFGTQNLWHKDWSWLILNSVNVRLAIKIWRLKGTLVSEIWEKVLLLTCNACTQDPIHDSVTSSFQLCLKERFPPKKGQGNFPFANFHGSYGILLCSVCNEGVDHGKKNLHFHAAFEYQRSSCSEVHKCSFSDKGTKRNVGNKSQFQSHLGHERLDWSAYYIQNSTGEVW